MKKTTETLLSQRLKELRADKGITQKQLASEIGVSYGSIVDYENGRREPNSNTFLPSAALTILLAFVAIKL